MPCPEDMIYSCPTSLCLSIPLAPRRSPDECGSIPWGPSEWSVCFCGKGLKQTVSAPGLLLVYASLKEGLVSACVPSCWLCCDPDSALWLFAVASDLNNNERGNAGNAMSPCRNLPKWIQFFILMRCHQSRCVVVSPQGSLVPQLVEKCLLHIQWSRTGTPISFPFWATSKPWISWKGRLWQKVFIKL